MEDRPFLYFPLSDRRPKGGVAAGTEVSFTLRVRSDVYLSSVTLNVRDERRGGESAYPGIWVGAAETSQPEGAGGYYAFRFYARIPAEGIYWYYFTCYQNGHAFYLCSDDRLNAFATGVLQGLWQLTAHRVEPVPEWFFGRTMYHVFVDRFARAGDVDAEEAILAKPGARLHASWGETPDFLPVGGKILNNDFFGGNLAGIESKLDYLAGLGVGVLYLSPVFAAASNHRYDTADYEAIDPLLGSEEDFRRLVQRAAERGIAVLLDGVFNHTGDDSRYFNKYGTYASIGAYQSKDSPYLDWYRFIDYPHRYQSWWGIDTLPAVNQACPAWREYIAGERGIAAKWLDAGISGWRLDVVDELSDEVLDQLCRTVRARKPDAVVIGEVWEDASDKMAYGVRRRYFEGGQLDSVMNYPVKNGIISFIKTGRAEQFVSVLEHILDHYPPHTVNLLMNILGTHDTARILTVLGEEEEIWQLSRQEKSCRRLSPERRRAAVLLLKCASLLQFTVPGVPCIYYGDEAGLEGYEDPFNRRCFPWGEEDEELTQWYRFLGEVRAQHTCFAAGDFRFLAVTDCAVLYERGEGDVVAGVNRGPGVLELPLSGRYRDLATGEQTDIARVYSGGWLLLEKI